MNKKILLPIALILSVIFSMYIATFAFYFLKGNLEIILNMNIATILNTIKTEPKVLALFLLIEIVLGLLLWLFSNKNGNVYKSKTVKLTDKIIVPNFVGQGQYGTSWWMSIKDLKKLFNENVINKSLPCEEIKINNAGVVVNYEIGKKQDNVICINKNLHTILIGASGSGKSRSVVIPTITALSTSDKPQNMFISDVKGELYSYTAENLKKRGYNVYVLDFINPKKSNRFNFLDPIIMATEKGDIPLAESMTSDLVSVLVPDNTGGKSEPIWRNGEQSIIKTGIMAVVLDNLGHREKQTLSNVYYFISEMFAEREDGEMLIDLYMEDKEANNPIKKFYAVASTAPSRTRGSFVTSALSTLQIFINEYIDNITCKSDFTFEEFEKHKTAIYVLLPDDKTTNNKLVSIMVQQIYTALVDLSRQNGGELKNKFHFILDEFSNFTKIDSFETMLTVSRSRNILYLVCIQSFGQIDRIYGKEGTQNFMDNSTLLYLKTNSIDTANKISEKLGTYTAQAYSESSNTNIKNNSSSSSMSLISRKVLTSDEVLRISNPYAILMLGGEKPYLCHLPDMSKTVFNKINEMGDEAHNLKLRMKREENRKEKEMCKSTLWDIWNKYIEDDEQEEESQEDIKKQEEFFEQFFKDKKGGDNE